MRLITIISVMCKLCMMMVMERINEWAEYCQLLGAVQGASKKGGVHKITCLCYGG